MVDDALKRLLNAELEAERIVAGADEQRQAIIEQAKRDARAEEQQHAERVVEIHASFRAQAEQRAQQTIAEMQRRYEEQERVLRAAANVHEQDALDEAIVLVSISVSKWDWRNSRNQSVTGSESRCVFGFN
jgi:V/A-type H+/Na+-transporting ATPase subunit G/H